MTLRPSTPLSAANDFAEWLAEKLPTLSFSLDIPSSSRVTIPITRNVRGIENVLSVYRWKSRWNSEGQAWNAEDWPSTRSSLSELRRLLGAAVLQGSDKLAIETCRRIVQWGGDRNGKVGAVAFLEGKAAAGSLVAYLVASKSAFDLSSEDHRNLASIELMNSMLTKVHALAATDGLPIYDSRVAAAIGSLAEIYRRRRLGARSQLPVEIAFPAVGGRQRRRTVETLCENVVAPGSLAYGASTTTARWSEAIVRLGRLLRAVLSSNSHLFPSEGDLPARVHALEASLFMIGYNVSSLATEARREAS